MSNDTNYDFLVVAKYDETAYKALAEAQWQLFRRPALQTKAYPVLVGTIAVIAINLFLSWSKYTPATAAASIALIVFLAAAFPLSGVSAKRKMYLTTLEDAKANNSLPMEIKFIFAKGVVVSQVGEASSVVKFAEINRLAALGPWRFLLFDRGAYILHRDSFSDDAELARFDDYLQEKCDKPIIRLKGKGPVRES